MSLSVFGAGFGRTGTDSMKRALEILGFDPCYHMYEVLPHQDRIDTWAAIANGATPDWDQVFDGYKASVDWPAAHFWREISAHFPDAKIVLSVRSSDSWWKSMDNTILAVMRANEKPSVLRHQMFVPHVFKGNIDDRDHVVGLYERHNAEVQAAFGPDRLLTYELGSGWDPLCAFLNVEIPDQPYPSGNSTAQFEEKLDHVNASRVAKES